MLTVVHHIAGFLGVGLSAATAAYLVLACWSVRRFSVSRANTVGQVGSLPGLSVLKPLCGSEPDLAYNLQTLFAQTYSGPLQIIFGVQSPDDPALKTVRTLVDRFPGRDVKIVIDDRSHGPNRKASNLVNMAAGAKYDLLAVSDSDVALGACDLAAAAALLMDPDVGAVTCLYRSSFTGRPGLAAQLGGLYIDQWILPSAVVAATLGPLKECYGPLTIIRGAVLQAGGGFLRLSRLLADDYELGQLTVRQGLRVVLGPSIIPTSCGEATLTQLLTRELRWGRTTRATEPMAYALAVITWPAPFLLPLLLFSGQPWLAPVVLTGLTGLRCLLAILIERRLGPSASRTPYFPLLLFLRETLCGAVWAASFFGSQIRWRGYSFRVLQGGQLFYMGDCGAEVCPEVIQ